MKWPAFLLGFFSVQVFSQETHETRELIGHLGGRTALLHLYSTGQAYGSARITGDYLVLPTLQQRFVEGERSKQLGVTFLKEGCAAMCGSQGYLEPLLVDRRGNCQLLGPQAK